MKWPKGNERRKYVRRALRMRRSTYTRVLEASFALRRLQRLSGWRDKKGKLTYGKTQGHTPKDTSRGSRAGDHPRTRLRAIAGEAAKTAAVKDS